MVTTSSPQGSNEFGPLLPVPSAPDEVAHGYTAIQVTRLAAWAARECNWVNGMAMEHRALTAWEAICEHLALASTRPEETELIATGWKAMKSEHYQDLKSHGWGGQNKKLISRAFLRYWTDHSAPTRSPEDAIVDRIALAQIWAALRPRHRDVLTALAVHDDRRAAERSLGMDPVTFARALGRARRAFYALWHEHETPSKMWGYDRPGAQHQNVMYLVRLRKRKAAQRRAESRPRGRIGRPPKDIGISARGLLERWEAGESYSGLARAFGVSKEMIRDRILRAEAERAEIERAQTERTQTERVGVPA